MPTMPQHRNTSRLVSLEAAYTHVKALPEWQGAQDDL